MPVDYFVTEVGGSSYVITLSVLISAGLLTLFTHLQGDLQAGGGGGAEGELPSGALALRMLTGYPRLPWGIPALAGWLLLVLH